MNYFNFFSQIERYYAFFQCAKILEHIGLTYAELLNERTGNRYREASNVFAYYIAICILYLDPNKFMEWCAAHNSHYFNFKQTKSTCKIFYDFIKKYYKNKRMFEILDEMQRDLKKLSSHDKYFLRHNLRMTSVEI